jgi:superfamily II DNA or RNA helicase
VHSQEGSAANDRVFAQLESHELDVIVQARMLGEGFDHPYLAVAMVGSIFANLAPFVQFVGRVMRAIVQNQPGHPLNQGVVVFHAGANVAQRWDDFRHFSQADREYFAQLLPELEEVDFGNNEVLDREPGGGGALQPVDILEERDVRAADMNPIGDPEVEALLHQLAARGISPDQAAEGVRRFRRMDHQDVREARRAALNARVQNEAGGILGRLGLPHGGKALDRSRRRDNYAWVVSELHTRVNNRAGGIVRQDFTLEQLTIASDALPEVAGELEAELRRGR